MDDGHGHAHRVKVLHLSTAYVSGYGCDKTVVRGSAGEVQGWGYSEQGPGGGRLGSNEDGVPHHSACGWPGEHSQSLRMLLHTATIRPVLKATTGGNVISAPAASWEALA